MLWTGNVIICYLPQQRTRDRAELPLLVRALNRFANNASCCGRFSQLHRPDQGQGAVEQVARGPRGCQAGVLRGEVIAQQAG
jgi:hypothetical protein